MTTSRILFFILFFVSRIAVFAYDDTIPERPSTAHWVNNLSKEMPSFLSLEETTQLENKLDSFATQTSNQIVIVIVDDLGGLEPASYATELGHKWGLGMNQFDNGVVILIKPTGSEGERNLFIAVGYGLESVIPDLTTKQIREVEMYPFLKKGEYFTALNKATDVLMALAKKEYNAQAYNSKNTDGFGWNGGTVVICIFGLLLILSLLVILKIIYEIIIAIYLIITDYDTFITSLKSFRTSGSFSSSGSTIWSFSRSSGRSGNSFGGGGFGGGGSGGNW